MPKTPEFRDFMLQAQMKRELAKNCRNILKGMQHEGAAASLLTAYAMELEERAEILEGLGSSGQIHGRSRAKGRAAQPQSDMCERT